MRALWLVLLVPGAAVAQDVDCVAAETQIDMTFCAAEQFREADADLNLAYGEARALMRQIDAGLESADRGAELALRDGQRAWITYRDQACEAEAYLWWGGSGQAMIYAACRARVTQARADDLWEVVASGS